MKTLTNRFDNIYEHIKTNKFDNTYETIIFIKNIFIRYKKLSTNLISNISLPGFLNKKIIIPIRGYKKRSCFSSRF